MHAQHRMQADLSVATLSLTVIAAVGQTAAHSPHLLHRSSWVMGEMLEESFTSL